MSIELSDIYSDGMSNCCSASVINPSGEGNEGVCNDCKEHCSIVREIDVQYIPNARRFLSVPDMRWVNHNFKLVRRYLIDVTDIPY